MRKFISIVILLGLGSFYIPEVLAVKINCDSPVHKNKKRCTEKYLRNVVIDEDTGLEVIEYEKMLIGKRKIPRLLGPKL